MNFISFFFFNIFGIGPKILVPIGVPCLPIKITEFSFNINEDPSFFSCWIFVRITKARNTPPLKTLDVFLDLFRSCWTETTTMSPKRAYLFLKPPKTFIHLTVLAPELSATFKIVCCCIIFRRKFAAFIAQLGRALDFGPEGYRFDSY